jgi:hypothetical protein
MTFFANAGGKWPSVKSQLQQAGTYALSGGSEFWRLLSKVEGRESDYVTTAEDEDTIKNACVKALQQAADTYSRSLESFRTEITGQITPAELELLGLPYFYSRYDYDGPFDDLFRRDRFDMRELYRELIMRIRNLASQVITIDFRKDRRDLAVQVFRAMHEWESISWIARLIAILNRRPDRIVE